MNLTTSLAPCQVEPSLTTPIGTAAYITTKLVAFVKSGALKWINSGLVGVFAGLNGYAKAAVNFAGFLRELCASFSDSLPRWRAQGKRSRGE